jgi:hypothetical protein
MKYYYNTNTKDNFCHFILLAKKILWISLHVANLCLACLAPELLLHKEGKTKLRRQIVELAWSRFHDKRSNKTLLEKSALPMPKTVAQLLGTAQLFPKNG